jgi:hypothetical protein
MFVMKSLIAAKFSFFAWRRFLRTIAHPFVGSANGANYIPLRFFPFIVCHELSYITSPYITVAASDRW